MNYLKQTNGFDGILVWFPVFHGNPDVGEDLAPAPHQVTYRGTDPDPKVQDPDLKV